MNALIHKFPQPRTNPFDCAARSRTLRRIVRCIQFAVAALAAAGLLAPLDLIANRRGLTRVAATSTRVDGPSPLETVYRQRTESNPQDVEAFEGMAILQVRRGAYEQAIESYRRVLDLAPNDHDALVGLGRALGFDGQFDVALRNFQAL